MNSVESVINPPWSLHVRFLNFNCVDPYVPSFNGDKYSFKVPHPLTGASIGTEFVNVSFVNRWGVLS